MSCNPVCRLALDPPNPTHQPPFAGILEHPESTPLRANAATSLSSGLAPADHPLFNTEPPPIDHKLPPLQLDVPLPPELEFPHQDDGLTDAVDFGIALRHDENGMRPIVAPERELAFSNATRVETNLLKLLTDMGAPLYGFQSVMEWAQDAQSSQYGFNPSNKTYDAQVRDLKKWLQMSHLEPQVIQVELPGPHGTTDTIPVTIFDFVAQLFSLLSDGRLNKLENLVVNVEHPFEKYVAPDGLLGEVPSGEWYHNAWDHMIEKGLKNFMIPIILYIDKTVISQSNKLSIHPVQMSLGIFTEECRRKADFWRPLGYISNEDVFFSVSERKELSADLKNKRFHTILRAIFSTYIEAQQDDALNEKTIQLGPHLGSVNLYLPLAYIIGDVEGGNALTGFRGSTKKDCPRVGRTCDCSTPDAHNTSIECNRILQADVKRMVVEGDLEGLHAMRQRPTYLVFFISTAAIARTACSA
jgi:hypothetical protein